MADSLAELTEQIRSRVAQLGYDLADLRRSGGGRAGGGRRIRLQVRIDRPDTAPGRGITVDECAHVSRALEQWLDETGLLGPRYVLEVSSPGIERPLRWREHWVRFTGQDVNVTIPERGRVRATIVRVEGDDVTLRVRDEEIVLPVTDLRHATVAVDWDALGITST